MRGGYFLIYRELFNKAWFVELKEKQLVVFHILNRVTWCGNTLKDGTKLKPGQAAVGRNDMARATGLSVQNIRTALKVLENVDFLTIQSTNTGSIVTVTNWRTYQVSEDETNQPNNQDLTNLQPTPNQPLTTINTSNTERKNNIACACVIESLQKHYPPRHLGAYVTTPNEERRLDSLVADYDPADLVADIETVKQQQPDRKFNPAWFLTRWEQSGPGGISRKQTDEPMGGLKIVGFDE